MEKIAASEHAVAEGQVAGYFEVSRAIGGTLLLSEDDEPKATTSFLAFSRESDVDPLSQPITFVYNGGPSTPATANAALTIGPLTVAHDANGNIKNSTPDGYSFYMDQGCRVYVDPPGTGLGTILTAEEPFWQCGVQRDVDILTAQANWYITPEKEGRPIITVGSSYGAFRAVGVALELAKQGLPVAAVVITAGLYDRSILDYQKADPIVHANLLPSLAATSRYHQKSSLDPSRKVWSAYIEAENLAQKDYLRILREPETFSPRERDTLAQQLSDLTGLPSRYFLDNDFRLDPDEYRRTLLQSNNEHISFIDSRLVSKEAEGHIDPATIDAWQPQYIEALRQSNFPGFSDEAVEQYKGIALLTPYWWQETSYPWHHQRLHEAVEELMLICPTIQFVSLGGIYDLNCPVENMVTFWQDMAQRTALEYINYDSAPVTHYWRHPEDIPELDVPRIQIMYNEAGHQIWDNQHRLDFNVALNGLTQVVRATHPQRLKRL